MLAAVLAASTGETVTAVGAASLLTVAISYSLSTARRARLDAKDLRVENALCNWRQAVLVEVMHNAGMPVPSWLWRDAPENVEKMSPEEQRTLAQKMIDPFGGTAE